MTYALRTPVRATLPSGRTVDGEIWGKSWNQATRAPVLDVYEFSTREWHCGLGVADLELLPPDDVTWAYTHVGSDRVAA